MPRSSDATNWCWASPRTIGPPTSCLRALPATCAPSRPSCLLDHRLTFNHRAGRWKGGAANVTPSPGDVVPCMAFEVDHPHIWDVLDAKEGVGVDVYERFEGEASPCCPTVRSRRSSPTGSRKGSWPATADRRGPRPARAPKRGLHRGGHARPCPPRPAFGPP